MPAICGVDESYDSSFCVLDDSRGFDAACLCSKIAKVPADNPHCWIHQNPQRLKGHNGYSYSKRV